MTAGVTENLAGVWWLVLLEGIAVFLLGILLVTTPGITVVTLVVFLGIYWLVSGLFSIVRILLKDSAMHWGWLLTRGVLGVLAGILVLGYPLFSTILSSTVQVIILGGAAILMGVISLIQASQGDGLGAVILGAINGIFGVILLASPLVPTDVLPLLLGILGLIGGVVLILLSFRIRKSGYDLQGA